MTPGRRKKMKLIAEGEEPRTRSAWTILVLSLFATPTAADDQDADRTVLVGRVLMPAWLLFLVAVNRFGIDVLSGSSHVNGLSFNLCVKEV